MPGCSCGAQGELRRSPRQVAAVPFLILNTPTEQRRTRSLIGNYLVCIKSKRVFHSTTLEKPTRLYEEQSVSRQQPSPRSPRLRGRGQVPREPRAPSAHIEVPGRLGIWGSLPVCARMGLTAFGTWVCLFIEREIEIARECLLITGR